jgi:(R)-2-hydroxyacyl-CoA dehydratese activating ATPase
MTVLKRRAGIDVGSRTVKLVVLDEQDKLQTASTLPAGFDPARTAAELLSSLHVDAALATGYGRYLLELSHGMNTVTEIKAFAVGALAVFPQCRTVLDIGGQDVKAIAISGGRVQRFEMNDRCAAGSGKFLEIMAATLGCEMSEFGSLALSAAGSVTISSMCTVFAESEVTSLVNKGIPRADIALALHHSIIKRAVSMLQRVSVAEPVVFAGGGALNLCLRKLLADVLRVEVLVPDQPQIIGALGAARLASLSP